MRKTKHTRNKHNAIIASSLILAMTSNIASAVVTSSSINSTAATSDGVSYPLPPDALIQLPSMSNGNTGGGNPYGGVNPYAINNATGSTSASTGSSSGGCSRHRPNPAVTFQGYNQVTQNNVQQNINFINTAYGRVPQPACLDWLNGFNISFGIPSMQDVINALKKIALAALEAACNIVRTAVKQEIAVVENAAVSAVLGPELAGPVMNVLNGQTTGFQAATNYASQQSGYNFSNPTSATTSGMQSTTSGALNDVNSSIGLGATSINTGTYTAPSTTPVAPTTMTNTTINTQQVTTGSQTPNPTAR